MIKIPLFLWITGLEQIQGYLTHFIVIVVLNQVVLNNPPTKRYLIQNAHGA